MLAASESARAARSAVVLLLAAVLFLNYVDRGTLPTAADLIQKDLHLSGKQLGLLLSAFFWTYAAMQIPAGWLAERYGAHRVLAAGLAIWALATMLAGVASGFLALLILRFLLGVGESAGFPCASKLLAAGVPSRSLGTANGIVAFAYLLGPAAGTYFGGLLMARYGWRAAFIVFGALSLLWLWPWSRVAVVAAARSRAPASEADTPTLGMILRQRALWGTGLGHFCSNYTFYFMLTWLPYYLQRERGFSLADMAQLAGSAYLVNAVCALLGGWAIDRFIARGGSISLGYKTVMATAHLGAVACMLGMAVGSRPVALSCIFIYQGLCGASSPGVFAVAQILAGPAAAGRWVGIQNTLGNLAGTAASLLTGLVLDATHRFTMAFVLAAAVSVFGFVSYVFILPRVSALSWRKEAVTAAA